MLFGWWKGWKLYLPPFWPSGQIESGCSSGGRVHVWGACGRRFKSCHPDTSLSGRFRSFRLLWKNQNALFCEVFCEGYCSETSVHIARIPLRETVRRTREKRCFMTGNLVYRALKLKGLEPLCKGWMDTLSLYTIYVTERLPLQP
jgi:hypothetical protein